MVVMICISIIDTFLYESDTFILCIHYHRNHDIKQNEQYEPLKRTHV